MIIVFNLDGTFAQYDGWEKHGKFPGPPRPDVLAGARRLKENGYTIGVVSVRGDKIVNEWVDTHRLRDVIDFVNETPDQRGHKPWAFCYIDDRAARYDGSNMEEICEKILHGKMEPWYKSTKEYSK